MKINDDYFFGKDLSYKNNLMEKVKEKVENEIPCSQISYVFKKRSMALCFEIPTMNEKNTKDMLLKIDWFMDEHFFKKMDWEN